MIKQERKKRGNRETEKFPSSPDKSERNDKNEPARICKKRCETKKLSNLKKTHTKHDVTKRKTVL